MAIELLPKADQQIIFRCMKAILDGPFLEDVEIHSRLGLLRNDLRKVLDHWPHLDDSLDDSNETLAINNCLNEVAYGISFSNDEWNQWFDFPRSEVERVYQQWAKLRKQTTTGIR